MLQLNNNVRFVLNEPKLPNNNLTNHQTTVKTALTSDVFEKSAQKDVPFSGLFDYFKTPKAMRKDPALKALGVKAINGNIEAFNKIQDYNLKEKDLNAVNFYLKEKLFDSCVNEPSAAKAQLLVKLNATPSVVKNLIDAKSTIEGLEEDRKNGWITGHWFKEMKEAETQRNINEIVLKAIFDDANPLQKQAYEQQSSALRSYIETLGPVIYEDRHLTRAKILAIDILKDSNPGQKEIDSMLKVLTNIHLMPDSVKIKIAEVLPEVVEKANVDYKVKISITDELSNVMKNTSNKELEMACRKAYIQIIPLAD